MESAWNGNLCLPEHFSVPCDRLKYLAWITSNRQTDTTIEMKGNVAVYNGINWNVFLSTYDFINVKWLRKKLTSTTEKLK